MAGKSIERMIRLLLDEVQTAVAASDWHTVERRAREILALDPYHTEATQYLAAAGRVFRFAPVAPRGRRFRLPKPSLPAIRIPAPPAVVSGALGGMFATGLVALLAIMLLSGPSAVEPEALAASPPPGEITPFLVATAEPSPEPPPPTPVPTPEATLVLAGATPEPTPEATPVATAPPRRTARPTATPQPTPVPCGARTQAVPGLHGASLAIEAGDGVEQTAAPFQSAPFSAYGSDACAGSTVESFVDGVSCGSAVADEDGRWLMQIGDGSACAPQSGDTITFTLDGRATSATETYAPGGAPKNVAEGVQLQ